MEANPSAENQRAADSRAQQLKAFFETREGVKGLVDSGITKIPSFFIHPLDTTTTATISPNASSSTDAAGTLTPRLQIPVIDLEGSDQSSLERRREVVDAVRDAAQTWGFFRMVNHGVPISIMENMLEAIRQFHEQPQGVKKAWYSRNEAGQRLFDYYTNVKVAAWRDTVAVEFPDGELNEQAIPQICRKAASEYMKYIVPLRDKLSELLSEAMGLRRDYLASIEGTKGVLLACHYHPPCPQPELTLATSNHTDASFLTILLEDNIDGLQVLHENQWVDVPHHHGHLTANIGDMLQMVSNDKLKSVTHRVLAGRTGPRISAACFFAPPTAHWDEAYEAAEKPPHNIYRPPSFRQYISYYRLNGRDGRLVLPQFKTSQLSN